MTTKAEDKLLKEGAQRSREPSFFGRGSLELPVPDDPSFFGRSPLQLRPAPEPSFMFPAGSRFGVLERGFNVVKEMMLDPIAPLTVNVGPGRPNIPLPRRAPEILFGRGALDFHQPAPPQRSLDLMSMLGFAPDAVDPLLPAAGKAGVPLMALLGKKAEDVYTGQRVFKGSGGRPHEALRGGEFSQKFAGDPTTGQGAQSFGHGLYFAENPKVAKDYQRELIDANGNSTLIEARIDVEPDEWLDWDKPLSEQSKSVLSKLKKIGVVVLPNDTSTGGSVYRRLTRGALDSPSDSLVDRFMEKSGIRLDERRLMREDEAVSRALREAGIPGIRYLDEGSRLPAGLSYKKYKVQASDGEVFGNFDTSEEAKGFIQRHPHLSGRDLKVSKRSDPTHNIVLFDASRAKAVRMNGKPILTTQGAPDLRRPVVLDAITQEQRAAARRSVDESKGADRLYRSTSAYRRPEALEGFAGPPVKLQGVHGTYRDEVFNPFATGNDRLAADFVQPSQMRSGGFHIGTSKAANTRLDNTAPKIGQTNERKLIEGSVVLNKPLGSVEKPMNETELFSVVNDPVAMSSIRERGFDGIIYQNVVEDEDSISAVVFDPRRFVPDVKNQKRLP